jgi:hypothetical protein
MSAFLKKVCMFLAIGHFAIAGYAAQNPCTPNWQWGWVMEPTLSITAPADVPDQCVGEITVGPAIVTATPGIKAEFDMNHCPESPLWRNETSVPISPVNSWEFYTAPPPGTTPTTGIGTTAVFTMPTGASVVLQFKSEASVESPPWSHNAGNLTNPFNVVGVELVSVDATDPLNAAANYLLSPSGLSATATFTAPGVKTSKTVSGSFSFIFDQDKVFDWHQLKVEVDLNGLVCIDSADVSVVTVINNDWEIVAPYFPGIGTRLYPHSLAERYRKVIYPTTYWGKTWKLEESTCGIDTFDHPIVAWGEQHKYSFETSFSSVTQPSPPGGIGDGTYRDRISNIWKEPGPYTGIARVQSLTWDTGHGLVLAWPINNRETDVPID